MQELQIVHNQLPIIENSPNSPPRTCNLFYYLVVLILAEMA